MFELLSGSLRWTHMIALTTAIATGGCNTLGVRQIEQTHEAKAPSDPKTYEAKASSEQKTQEAKAPSDPTELTKNIQKMLTDKGFDAGPIDGIAGPQTLSALTAFQTKNGLPSTNGVTAQAYGQLSISTSSHEPERRKSEQQNEQSARAVANKSSTVEGNSSSNGASGKSSNGSVAEQEAAKRKELSRNDASVKFQVSCPDLFIPKVYEKLHQNQIPVYAMVVLNNSSKRYSVQYDLVYEKGTQAVASKNVFGTTLPGRQGYSETLTETKSFTVRPGTLTEFLLIQKNQGSGKQVTSIKAVDMFKCSSP